MSNASTNIMRVTLRSAGAGAAKTVIRLTVERPVFGAKDGALQIRNADPGGRSSSFVAAFPLDVVESIVMEERDADAS